MKVTIPLDVWDSQCHVLLWPDDLAAELDKLDIEEEGKEFLMEQDYEGITTLNDRNEPVIVIRAVVERTELLGLLAHESFHAASMLLEVCGVKLSKKGNNEAHAYLIGYIVREVVKCLDKMEQHHTLRAI